LASVVKGFALLKAGGGGGGGVTFYTFCFTEKPFTLYKYSVWNQDGFEYGTRMVLNMEPGWFVNEPGWLGYGTSMA
jgi:hypothetical protein